MKWVRWAFIFLLGAASGAGSSWWLRESEETYVITQAELKDSRGVILPKGTHLKYLGFVHTAGLDEGFNRFSMTVAFDGRGEKEFQETAGPTKKFWDGTHFMPAPDYERDYFFEADSVK
jgi:hypothetical protein